MSMHARITNLSSLYAGGNSREHREGFGAAKARAAEIAAEGDALIEELAKALERMCSVWVTVCNSKGWEPEHMSQYTDARVALAKVRG